MLSAAFQIPSGGSTRQAASQAGKAVCRPSHMQIRPFFSADEHKLSKGENLHHEADLP